MNQHDWRRMATYPTMVGYHSSSKSNLTSKEGLTANRQLQAFAAVAPVPPTQFSNSKTHRALSFLEASTSKRISMSQWKWLGSLHIRQLQEAIDLTCFPPLVAHMSILMAGTSDRMSALLDFHKVQCSLRDSTFLQSPWWIHQWIIPQAAEGMLLLQEI